MDHLTRWRGDPFYFGEKVRMEKKWGVSYTVSTMSEREKQYIPPMSGQEVADMFGDRRLLILEEGHKRLSKRLEKLAQQIKASHEDPELNLEDLELLEAELFTTREFMREQDRVIRKAANEYGLKRGPVTLH